ncbi:MAG TPA: Chromate resistance protein ChrB [Rectinemataceae bacterium]|nr:Chromate resistance protein ChrB [Rectinemataceae bacterium]
MAKSSWSLFIYQIPALPSTHRAYAWRKLKSLGALYLQNSICLLPVANGMDEKLGELKEEIAKRGGNVQLFHINVQDQAENDALVEKLRSHSSDEYEEFLEQCDNFHEELQKERDARHLTFGELEENEAELQRLKTWLPKIRARDFFKAPLGETSSTRLVECEKDFRLFGKQVERSSI